MPALVVVVEVVHPAGPPHSLLCYRLELPRYSRHPPPAAAPPAPPTAKGHQIRTSFLKLVKLQVLKNGTRLQYTVKGELQRQACHKFPSLSVVIIAEESYTLRRH